MKTTHKVLILAGVAAALFVLGRSSSNWGTVAEAEAQDEHVHE